MPEPIPFGLTRLVDMTRAIVLASLLNVSFGGNVDSVSTLLTQRRPLLRFAVFLGMIRPSPGETREPGSGRRQPRALGQR
jgi:hypothetical protein